MCNAARRALAEKVAYYGHALSPLIWSRLNLTWEDFEPITQALMVERDNEKAIAMVDDRMLAIGVVGSADDVIRRLEPLVAAGVTHLTLVPRWVPTDWRRRQPLGQAGTAAFSFGVETSGGKLIEMTISIAFQTDKPLAAYGALAAQAEAYGFDGVTVYNDMLYEPAWPRFWKWHGRRNGCGLVRRR